jgi:hypothetical protein
MTDPCKAIASLESLNGEISQLASAIRWEGERIADEWEGLRRVGGQRADHAAKLLSRLRPVLRDLGAFCQRVEGEIDGMVADPFERKDEAA